MLKIPQKFYAWIKHKMFEKQCLVNHCLTSKFQMFGKQYLPGFARAWRWCLFPRKTCHEWPYEALPHCAIGQQFSVTTQQRPSPSLPQACGMASFLFSTNRQKAGVKSSRYLEFPLLLDVWMKKSFPTWSCCLAKGGRNRDVAGIFINLSNQQGQGWRTNIQNLIDT